MKMTNDAKVIQCILIEISQLLIEGNRSDWGSCFFKFSERIETHLTSVKDDLRKLYGGMGSFNDIVLYKNQKLLVKENARLDFLRGRLFNLIRNV